MERNVEKITSRSNPVCVHIKKLGTNKKYREDHGQFLCEGKKLLSEALSSGIIIDSVLSSTDIEYKLPDSTRVYSVSDSIIDSLSPLRNSREVLFSCKIPEPSIKISNSGTHILLDIIQDPGNVGTIIRSAHAFGIDSIILTEGSADIFNPKTIRASMGAVFKQHICIKSFKELYDLKKAGLTFLGATTTFKDSQNIKKVCFSNTIIVLGNEGQGISMELIDLCDKMITIPLSPSCESLNVAAAASIIMWEASKDKEF